MYVSFMGDRKLKQWLDLNSLMLFYEVAKSGSLASACERLQVPRSTLSRRLLQLEKEMGTLLLKKNTRKLAPTDIGLGILEHCERILSESNAVTEKISRMQTDLQGTLRIAIPNEFGTAWLGKAVSEFAVRYPELQVEIEVSDRVIDLINESVDVSISFGRPKASRITQRRLGSVSSGIYASPEYIARHGLPSSLDEIRSHDCIVTDMQRRQGVWLFRGQNRNHSVGTNGRIRVNNIRLARELAIGGSGLGLLPHIMCSKYVASRQLVRVLPSWDSPALHVVALFLSRTRIPNKTRVLLDFVAEQLLLQKQEVGNL
jgi:DNA-binding transcriptional LysR family regulator